MRFSDLAGRRVGVWGLGREGRAVADAVRSHLSGTELVLVDEGAGDDPVALLSGCDVVVRSPGVSRYRPEVRAVRMNGVDSTTGTNLWFAEHPDALAIGITGSKGKSTTASLAAHLATRAGLDVRLAGNIGVPLAGFLGPETGPPPDLWVLELSSYQTSDLDASPPIGVLLNLYREHTDWHGTQDRYHADKLNLFAHRSDMTSVLNAADPAVRSAGVHLPHAVWFRDPGGFDAGPGGITRAGAPYLARADVPLAGDHNLDNLCAALSALECAGVHLDDPAAALAGFRPLAHRLEPLGERDGVLWVNDSIATIPEATVAAARALAPRPTVILVGGRDRTQDYGPLAAYLASGESAVAGLVAMPANGADVLARVGEEADVPSVLAGSLEDAVARARAMVPADGAVLLSPGAPSGDDFADFAARGDAFRRLAGIPGTA